MIMTNKNLKKKQSSVQNGFRKGNKRFKSTQDPFFDSDTKRRRFEDDTIESSDEESEEFNDSDGGGERETAGDTEVVEGETADEKRKRLAEAFLDNYRGIVKRQQEEEDDSGDGRDKEHERDSIVANLLQQEQLEDSGRVRRLIASRVQTPEITEEFQILVKHRQSVTAVALSDDDLKGFSASKDGKIFHWDVDSGKREEYVWPGEEVLKSHGAKGPQGRVTKHSKHVLALAVSSDGRYLASGGFDRHVHLWDTRTREHIQAFSGHKGPVSCLTFRQGTSELFSGSYDRTIKIWNAEDISYITTLFGHQSDVLTIDCLRKERVLTVGRDRTMHLWKVPEESQLVFRAPASSLECCCFINNDEFLSGSDDGSIEHWSVLRKKPLHIVKNAHTLLTPNTFNRGQTDDLSNGSQDGLQHSPESSCSSAHSWVGSVAVCRSSDLAASGAGNGSVHLWQIESDSKGIRPLFELPLVGFVNSLAFSKSGKFLVAGVGKVTPFSALLALLAMMRVFLAPVWVTGRLFVLPSIYSNGTEPRLGRWGSLPAARHGIFLHSLRLS